MLLLNLDRIRTAQERFEHVYPPETFPVSGDADRDPDMVTVTAPTSLAFEVFKDKDRFRLAGRVETTVQLVCGRCLEPFLWPIDEAFDLRYQPLPATASSTSGRERGGSRDSGRRFFDGVLRERRDRPRAVDAGAVLSGAADEAALQARLPRPLPALRHELESRHLRVHARLDRPALRGAEESSNELRTKDQGPRTRDAESQTTTLENPHRKTADHDTLKPVGLSECPHCHEPKQPHRVCANCGYYRGRQARAVSEE